MSDLIVIAYDDIHTAEEMRMKLVKMQNEYLIDMEDAVVATKDNDGKVKLHQAINLTAFGALQGSLLGGLVGVLLLNPLFGMAIGGAAGALSGATTDLGINDDFMKELAATLKNDSSALFILVRKVTMDKVLPQLEGTGGKIIKTSLPNLDEEKLQSTLDKHRMEYSKTPTV